MEFEGLRVGGRNMNYIRYADDTVFVADSEKNCSGKWMVWVKCAGKTDSV